MNKPQHSLKDCSAYSFMTVHYISATHFSNLVVSIVEHVYRMNALLLYITLRNSPQWGLFLSLLGAIPGGYILTHYGRCFGTYVHMKQTICLHTWCLCFLLLSGMPGLKLLLVTLLKIVALHFNLTTWYI